MMGSLFIIDGLYCLEVAPEVASVLPEPLALPELPEALGAEVAPEVASELPGRIPPLPGRVWLPSVGAEPSVGGVGALPPAAAPPFIIAPPLPPPIIPVEPLPVETEVRVISAVVLPAARV